jgi:hypothetical protein
VAKPKRRRAEVFLNIPYDKKFERLFIAYIAGLTALGLVPRATLEIPDSSRRLDKILVIIRRCKYSVHDLSRVELDRHKPKTPRFNMPFELGLTVAAAARKSWYVFEAVDHRLEKSLNDLNGTDPKIHNGTVEGVLSGLCDSFVREVRRPTMSQMMKIYRNLRRQQVEILKQAGANSVYRPRAFRDICVAASALAGKIVI